MIRKIAMLLFLFFMAKKPGVWETGKVISQNQGSERSGAIAAPISNTVVAVPIDRNCNAVVIETEKYIYQWSEVGNRRIILPVNGTTAFYRDGSYFIVLDNQGKKHKFVVTHIEAK